jgi:hypothetical protein
MGAHAFWPVAPADLPAALLDPARWPRKPYCSDDKTARNIRPFLSALKRSYIQANPPHLRVWSIYDIDRPGAAIAWEDAMLPPPSWAVVDVETKKGHLAYGLSVPVLVDSPDMRQKPLRYLCAVEAAFRAKLGADQGYSGLMTKNPAHERWRVMVGPPGFYELFELAGWVDLPRFIPKRGRNPEEIGLGRNVTLFDDLSKRWAYKKIREYKPLGLPGWNPWMAACYAWALERNGDFPNPMDGREVWHIAKSVGKWTWRHMSLEGWRRWVAKTHNSEIQAIRGRKGGVASGAVRLAASEENRASARLMAAQGMTQAAIAAELGVSRETIRLWLRDDEQ